MFSFTDFSKKN